MCQKMREIVGVALLGMALIPAAAGAQSVAIGPRFSLIRGDLDTSTPTNQFLGGVARLNLAGNLSLEGSIEVKNTWNTDHTERVREVPMQGSVLIFPIHSSIAPYVLGGLGLYSREYSVVNSSAVITQTAQERKVGLHLGFGGEVRVGRHALAFLDYRYRFVKFGNDADSLTSADNSESAVTKLLKAIPALGQLNVSHQGSMWTGGVAFVF